MVDQFQFTQIILSDVPKPITTYKEVGVELRYVGGQVVLEDAGDDGDISDYVDSGGCITLTAADVRPKDVVNRGKGRPVSDQCDRMLASGQQFIVKGDLFCVLGLLWVGFGKVFKDRKGAKTKKPAAPLLILAAPPSCRDIPEQDFDRYVPHLVLFTAHHVLESAAFPVTTIRRHDIAMLSSVFAQICRRYNKKKAFWKQIPRM